MSRVSFRCDNAIETEREQRAIDCLMDGFLAFVDDDKCHIR